VLVYIAPRVGCWLQSKKGSSFLPEGASHLSAGEIIELTAQFLSAGLAIWLIFGYAPAIPYQPLYLLFVPVIWVSVRRGLPGAVLMTFAISVGMTLAAWITQAHKGSLPRLQLALLALGLTGLCLGALVTEQGRVQRVIRESERRYRLLFERNLAGVFRTTLTGRVLECNQATANIFGYASPTEVMALPAETFYEEKSDREKLLTRIRSERSITNHEVKFRRKNGDSVWTMLNMSLVADEPGSGEFLEATMVDITQRKLAEERVRSLAYYDALTGLANRTLLLDRLSKALASARRQKRKVALLFLDLDRFKVINDSLGHSVGDLLLKEVAARLKRVTRDPDTAARLGGDEFLILLTDVEDISGVAVAAKRFMDAISAGYSIQSHYLNVSCSLGISIFPEHGADNDTLIKHADAAMYTAKESGRNDFRFFTADMNTQAVARLALENGLRSALANNELFLVYQPQMDMRTGKTNGLEALLRWQHPDIGLVSPNDFIRIAENSGLIITIGEWVLKSACSQARKWQDEGLPPVSIAVNVSAVQFRQENFPQTIEKVLRETGLDPKYLELELTESLLLSNADVMFSVLQQLTVMGVRLAIDDFGTGYSSLSYLKRFPVSKLKIDGSFIRDVALHQDDAAITIAIISMAKSLKLKVVAEGVENEAQLSFLRGQGCDGIQGYHFSKPLELCKVEDKLRTEYPDAKMTPQSTEACEPHQGASAS
jgi:diguanylate cyclase (GGDEF)-like protein/PAS domain S-box-containing protein